ncbi:hypothetical protein Dsin_010997 [Dipteronia sinensis]|uniref:Uncharacterized protein n=1 Tax=Dipteronia sinensis TaxID=43782 RepID=A0AAE0EDL6_9ROSI|nr:hypothetical protein Dsin_010997 [Dipteronia sinensis]
MLKSKPRLEECQKEKKLLLGKLEVLEENIIKLQMDLRERSDEAAGGGDMNKTEYAPPNKLEDESNLLSDQQKPITYPDLEDKNPSYSTVDCDTKKKLVLSGLHPLGEIPGLVNSQVVLTPHDDFLDTPLENIWGTLKEEVCDLLVAAPKDKNVDSSDDETQDMNVDTGPQKQQMPGPMAGKRGFRYVEPVRKKAEQENLKGIECKQCKKLNDAVLPDNEGQDSDDHMMVCSTSAHPSLDLIACHITCT